MRRHRVPLAILAAAALIPGTARALDLNGKWRFTGVGPAQIVQVTQSGSALSIPFQVPFTGTVTPGSPFSTFSVTASVPPFMAGIFGRITPSENLLHGRSASGAAPDFIIGTVVATRCTCDDGNTTGGDGCDAACRVEPCWTCTGDPSVCTPAAEGSACDDGTFCTTGETCTAGVCGGGTPVSPCVDMTATWTQHREIPLLGETFDFVSDIVQLGTDVFAGDYLGTIDSATGAFNLAAVNPNLFCPSFDTLVGSLAATNATYSASGVAWVLDPFAADQCDGFIQIECGSTAPGPIESCGGSTTTTSTSTTTTSTTPPLPACAPTPLPGCRLPTQPGKGKLLLKDKMPDTGDVVTWKWTKGAATTPAEFGNPDVNDDYVACLYDGAAGLLMTLRMPAGGVCGSKPCWKPRDGKGFVYADKERTPNGVKKLTLGAGVAGKARIAVSAKGDAIPLPALGAFTLPLRLQLQGNGLCWEAVYGTPQQNTNERFKAVSD